MTIAKTGTLNYVSPESETIVIHNEGTVLSGSHDNEFEFIYEDEYRVYLTDTLERGHFDLEIVEYIEL